MAWPLRAASWARAIRGMHFNKEGYAMSKTEDVRGRSMGMGLGSDGGKWGGSTRTQPVSETDEAAMLQDRLALLNKQEHLRAKSTAEVISLLQTLIKDIKATSESVRTSAYVVRSYPVEVVTQLSTRLEVCVARCEDAAKRAGELFDCSKGLCVKVEKYYLLLLFTSCLGVGIIMGAMFVFLPKIF